MGTGDISLEIKKAKKVPVFDRFSLGEMDFRNIEVTVWVGFSHFHYDLRKKIGFFFLFIICRKKF